MPETGKDVQNIFNTRLHRPNAGVHKPVADALATRLLNFPHLENAVILDIDPEVYRLGYGHIDGLTTLKTLCD
ncbi:MAG: hypothetical protein FJ222_08160 [Lentisphaerae bacterium]|nr:hypothetical protein [Lentisphaerota bacterium]